jgi:hypothetical protein
MKSHAISITQEKHLRTNILLITLLSTLASGVAQANDCKQEPGQPDQVCQQRTMSSPGKSSNQSDTRSKQDQQPSHQSQSHKKAASYSQQQHAQVSHSEENHKNRPTEFKKGERPKGMYIVRANGLNIRNEPAHHAKVHGRFHGGQQVEVYDIVDGWAKILFDGQYLWVSAEYMQRIGN